MLKFKIRKGEIRNNGDTFIIMFSGLLPNNKEVALNKCKILNKIYNDCKLNETPTGHRERIECYSINGTFTLLFNILNISKGKLINNWKGKITLSTDAVKIRVITPVGIIFEGKGFIDMPKSASKYITFETVAEEHTNSRKILIEQE